MMAVSFHNAISSSLFFWNASSCGKLRHTTLHWLFSADIRPVTYRSAAEARYSYRCLPIAITWHLNTTDTMHVSVQLRTCPKTVRDYPIRSFRLQLVFTTKSLQGMAGMALLPSSSGGVHVHVHPGSTPVTCGVFLPYCGFSVYLTLRLLRRRFRFRYPK
ncbi:hypothetical protein I7I50_03394 [Histoplasma capsulatum G186AR]|uniref:Uncharacterized protein n=1 Tax=Ajellomyces capsulatus TaxID=5037 RepID=A0A8H7YL49_AJECA|nr:hypothetical protein I7I52_04301 [Histoplasma capsulatum]QSS74547.1 hypothetical protein I7I50_03394 [Histoplasma capsulatum G186AR]